MTSVINRSPPPIALLLIACVAIILTSYSRSLFVLAEGADIINDQQVGGRARNWLQFSSFVNKFRKSYEMIEYMAREKLFMARSLKFLKHNILFKQRIKSYYLAQNEFTDLTPAEFKSIVIKIDGVVEAKHTPDSPADKLLSTRSEDDETLSGMGTTNEPGQHSQEEAFAWNRVIDILGNGSDDGHRLLSYNQKDDKTDDSDMYKYEIQSMMDVAHSVQERAPIPHVAGPIVDFSNDESEANEVNTQIWNKLVDILGNGIDDSQLPVANRTGELNEDVWLDVSPQLPPIDETDDDPETHMNPNSWNFAYRPVPEITVSLSAGTTSRNEKIKSTLPPLRQSFKRLYDSIFGTQYLVDMVDLGPREFERFYQMNSSTKKRQPKRWWSYNTGRSSPATTTIYKVDHRTTSCIFPSRNQGRCNSCYAFAAISLFEYFHCMETKKLIQFSEQYVVDCGDMVGLKKCKSGKYTNVGLFVQGYGLELASLYPYSGTEGTCKVNKNNQSDTASGDGLEVNVTTSTAGTIKPKIVAWQIFHSMSAWGKWVKTSPILVGINLPADFLGYAGGVHDGLDCIPGMGHSMLLVGHGVEDNKQFWIMKNSYGTEWGEGGYFKLAKSAPLKCFGVAAVARMSFKKANNSQQPST